MPSFMRDWVLKRFQDDEGEIDVDGLQLYSWVYSPKRGLEIHQEPYCQLSGASEIQPKYRLISISRHRDFFLRFPTSVLPPRTIADSRDVWGKLQCGIIEGWGELGNRRVWVSVPEMDRDSGKLLVEFPRLLCPYIIDLDEYNIVPVSLSPLMSGLTLSLAPSIIMQRWLRIPPAEAGYDYEIALWRSDWIWLSLPSKVPGPYLFGSVSRCGWFSSGGTMSRAKMFMNAVFGEQKAIFTPTHAALDEVWPLIFARCRWCGALGAYGNGKHGR